MDRQLEVSRHARLQPAVVCHQPPTERVEVDVDAVGERDAMLPGSSGSDATGRARRARRARSQGGSEQLVKARLPEGVFADASIAERPYESQIGEPVANFSPVQERFIEVRERRMADVVEQASSLD